MLVRMNVVLAVGTRRTPSFAPFSARNLAIIFILRPIMAAKTIGNIVGPYHVLVGELKAKKDIPMTSQIPL